MKLDLSIIGKRFGKLTVVSFLEMRKYASFFNCLCDCGKTTVVMRGNLMKKNTLSCGCYNKQRINETCFVDRTGQKFNRLTFVKFIEVKNKTTYWEVKCDCGFIKTISSSGVVSGKIISCGCYRNQILRSPKTHGGSHDTLYGLWRGIIQRCTDKNCKIYKHYGGRGISICNEWKNDYLVFKNWAIQNGYSKELSIERIENNGNYEPGNCRWATDKEQSRNRRNNVRITIDGVTKILKDWCIEYGVNSNSVSTRINRGWNAIEALRTPMGPQRNKGYSSRLLNIMEGKPMTEGLV